jgi:hypothetical protein
MPRFRLRSDAAVDLFFPAGHTDSLHVAPGDVVDVPGELAPEQPDDAFLVGEGDDARLWPKALWEDADPTPAPDPAPDQSAPAESAPVTEEN